jgi:hypothetical protein
MLQTGVMIPITDPAERADLDRRCREEEKKLAAPRKAKPRKGK